MCSGNDDINAFKCWRMQEFTVEIPKSLSELCFSGHGLRPFSKIIAEPQEMYSNSRE